MFLRVVERVKCGDFRNEKKKCVENAGELMFVRSQGVRGFYLGYI